MSKHPIDDLFASQLKDHGVKPERATWEELQRRMKVKERNRSPFVVWYASAASIAVVVLASWWLWSRNEADKMDLTINRTAQQVPKKVLPAQQSETVTTSTDNSKPSEQRVIAYHKPSSNSTNKQAQRNQPPIARADEKPLALEKPLAPIGMQQMETTVAQVAGADSGGPERTLVVQIAALPMNTADYVTASEANPLAIPEDQEEQPRKKRFRLGRVWRQINKLKAGEAVEWEEVGVQPGALMARATEKVQEGKEKLADSYENLRYNAFRKNSNNK